MDRDFLIRLTNNLYHLTLLFPKKEPLRYKMRELADEILANFIKINSYSNPSPKVPDTISQLLEDLEVLDSFFAIAKEQNWVIPSKLFSIQREYSKIKEYAEGLNKEKLFRLSLSVSQPEKGVVMERSRKDLNGRQQKILGYNPPAARQGKILEYLKEKEKAQVGEFKEVFPGVTKRTLRRDFQQLLKDGRIERMGERNNTYYRISSRT